ncbi:MAG TPA: hypothetical protein VMU47_14700 [Caldimonas sp.]|nr:hypothetical protein [Caldimonas sp.]
MPPIASALRFAIAVFGLAALAAHAQVPPDKAIGVSAEAVAACERAARESLGSHGLAATDVTFPGAPTVDRGLSNETRALLRGSGRSRGASGVRTFEYSCNVDLRTAEAVGLVLRDTLVVAAKREAPPAPAEPDLSHLSPAACESSAVQALKQRWPRVSQIAFDAETRTFAQASAEEAALHGRGRALPAPDQPATLFGFDCVIDPRDGRVLATRVSD